MAFLVDLKPELGLWVSLNIFFAIAKRTPVMPGWIIPWISFLLGGIVYPLVYSASVGSVPKPLASQVIIGLMIGGAAVGGHQLFKRTTERLGFTFGETEIIERRTVSDSGNVVIDEKVTIQTKTPEPKETDEQKKS